ncbi:DNA methyltransferase [Methyloceanibacter stevinii]|uniref:site-specific DNA-methyltransferase (adenine-specific) n=1 Tax=Methyloceanibacter stevinii TaxID=1774970 RepID=A0A1E3VJ28_9HYPH|nr:DNA adenine methylase [Methyloceanibacter stevinii]ODR93512.1 DNA methyltransferase [Methyloceanibacter stevinii]
MRNVKPATPAAPYTGGKRNLAGRLVAMIERTPHETYVEPFVGMGGIFFRRSQAAKCEVINDANGEVANLFRILQRHYVPFMDMLRYQLTSRREFERLSRTDPTTLTDLQRAARFLYLQRTAYGGKVDKQNFGVSVGRPGTFDVTKLGPVLEELHERLSGVIIECLGWAEVLDRYDRKGTLFYLDPPYWGTEHIYGRGLFERAEFEALSDRLKALRGRFILSINDVPEIRDAFSWARKTPVTVNYSIQGGGGHPAGELIITGRG